MRQLQLPLQFRNAYAARAGLVNGFYYAEGKHGPYSLESKRREGYCLRQRFGFNHSKFFGHYL
jgi:hypothetical protein